MPPGSPRQTSPQLTTGRRAEPTGNRVQVARGATAREEAQPELDQPAPRGSTSSVSWKYACTCAGSPGRRTARSRSPAPCVVGTALEGRPAESIRPAEASPGGPSGRYGRARRRGVTVDVPERGACLRDAASVYQPPPQKSVGAKPHARGATRLPGDPLARLAAGRTGVCRAREVCVVAERPEGGDAARARSSQVVSSCSPASGSGAGSAPRRGSRRAGALQRGERGPHAFVERSFDVARDDCVPFRDRGRHRATHTTFAPWCSWSTAAALPRLAVLAVERNDVLTRYVEKSDTFARTLVSSGTFGFLPGVPSAYTQPLYALVPRRPLLAARAHVARGRARADRRGGRDRARRPRIGIRPRRSRPG